MSSAELPIEHMCALAGVSRRGFYRFDPEAQPAERDMELRDAIQRIALEMPSYGRPRITAELRRRGWVVNAKRVHRIMREDNLLCLRRRRSILTTDSRHAFGIYPNLAGEMKLTNVNQLWIADITYIQVGERVRESCRRSGCLLTPRDRLGSGPPTGGEAHSPGAEDDPFAPSRSSGPGASFRPSRSVCTRRVP